MKSRERTELDNDALPPTLDDEVRHDRQRVSRSSTSSGRDSYVASIVNFFSSNKDLIVYVVLAASLFALGSAYGTIQAQQLENEKLQRSTKQTIDLQRENFADFIRLVYNPLAAKVEADHVIIEAFALNKTVSSNCKRN